MPARASRRWTICGLIVAALALAAPGTADAAPPVCDPLALPDVHSGQSTDGALVCDDADGDPLGYAVAEQPPGGVAQVDAAGSVTYTASFDFAGPDAFTVVVDDGTGESVDAPVTVDVVNERPVCQGLQLQTAPDQMTFAGADCTDPDFDFLQYAIATQPENGTATATFGGVQYTPEPGFTGTDTFTYVASDGIEDSLPATVTIAVVNAAPECFDDTRELRTGKPLTQFLSCFDDDGHELTLAIVDAPAHGDLTFGDDGFGSPTFTYAPDPGFTGADHFTFRANDGFDDSAPARIDLVVTPNHAPECDLFPRHTGIGDALELSVFCSDDDAQDASSLTYELSAPSPANGAISGFEQEFGSASLTYTPDAGFEGADELGITASDGELETTAVQRIHVSDQPMCAPLPARTIRPDRSFFGNLNCTRPPDDFGPLTYSVVTAPAKGTLSSFGFGAFSYMPNLGATGADSFQLRATSSTTGDSNVVTQQVTIDPNANVAPTCFDTTPLVVYSARETGITAPCSDADFDELTVAANGSPAHGALTVDGDLLIYSADAGYVGLDTIAFTVSDGRAAPVPWTVEVDVRAPQVPTCEAVPALQLRPGRSTDFFLDCSDPQHDDQEYEVVQQPAKGSVELDELGGGVYTADAGPDGSDTFTLRATNPVGPSAPVTVDVTIAESTNSAPQCFTNAFNPHKVATGVATTLPLEELCDDADGDPLTFTRLSGPANGTVPQGPAAALTYTSNDAYLGPDSFTFIATDVRSTTSTVVTFHVDVVTSVTPTCTPQPTVTLRPSRSKSVFLSCVDPNFNPITYRIVNGPQKGTLAPPGDSSFAARTYTATTAVSGDSDSFTYRAVSAGGTSELYTQSFDISSAANEPPTCTTGPAFPRTVLANRSTTLHGVCFDADGDTLTYAVLSAPEHGEATVSGGTLVYTPDAGYTGADQFNFSVNDGHGGSVSPATLHLSVFAPQPPNCGQFPPVAVRTNSSGRSINTLCSSGIADQPTYVLDVEPEHGELTQPGGPTSPTWVYAPDPGFTGPDSFTWHAENAGGESEPRTQQITVSDDANTAPSCPPTVGLTARPGVARALFSPCFDADGDTLTPAVVDPPDHGTLNTTSLPWTYTANVGYTGPDSFSVSFSDGHGGTTTVTVIVNVTNANTPPTCFGTTITVQSGTTHTFPSAPCSDPDGDPVTLVLVQEPEHGVVGTSPSGLATYTPDPGYTGPDSFTFKGNDGIADSAVHTVGITVTGTPGPTCEGFSLSTLRNEPVVIELDCFAQGGASLTYQIVTPPAAGTGTLGPIDQQAGTVTFTPAAGFTGTATFTYRASSGGQQSAPETVSIDVGEREFAPVVWLDASTETPRTGSDVTFTAFAYDPDGGAFTYAWFVDGVEIDGADTDELVRQFGAPGTHTVRVEVTDGEGDTSGRELTIDAHAGNLPPELYLDTERDRVAVGASLDLSAYSFDPDGEITGLEWDIDGTSVPVSGGFDFRTVTFDTPGTKTISVTATDDSGGTTIETVQIEVTNENTAPEPEVSWWPVPAKQGQPTHFVAFADDAEGDAIETYEWDFDDDGTFEVVDEQFPAHTFATRGDKRIRVRLTDARGEAGTTTVTVKVVNSPPIARIGGPSAVERNTTATLTDASTDPGGSIASREWDLDGDGDFDDGTSATAPFEAGPVVGTKTLRLRVTDNEGETSTAIKTITVRTPQDAAIGGAEPPAGGPPITITTTVNPQTGSTTIVIPQGQAGQFPNGCVPLDISVSLKTAAGATVLSATLVLTPNTGAAQQSFTMTNAGGGNWMARIDCAVPGTMKVVYTVREADGDEVEFERDVGTIALIDPQGIVHDRAAYDAALDAIGKTDATATPDERADARDAAAIEGATVTLQRLVGGDWVSVSASDPGIDPNVNPQVTGSNGLYQWDVSAGTYRVVVTAPGYRPVTSDAQVIPPPVLDLHIPMERNQAPVASVAGSDASVPRGQAVEFTLTAEDSDGDVVARDWDLDGDGQFDDATGASAQRDFSSLGTKTVKARVTDDEGESTIAAATVLVLNREPAVGALMFSPSAPTAGEQVTFTASGSDPDGDPLGSAWDLDDDGQYDDATGASAQRSFPAAGSYEVAVRMTDGNGGAATKSVAVAVAAAPPPPPPPPLPPPPPPPSPVDNVAPRPAVAVIKGQKLKTVLKKGLKLTVGCDEPCAVKLAVTVDKATAKKLKLAKKPQGAVTIGSLSRPLGAAGTVTVKLSAKARGALKKAKKVKLRFAGTATDAAGNSSKLVLPPLSLKR